METTSTKKCAKCGRELPVTDYYFQNGKPRSYCKDCYNELSRLKNEKAKLEKSEKKTELSRYTPRELINELIDRGYRGRLYYTQEIKLEK